MDTVLSISISDAIFRTSNFINNVTDNISSYSHTISAWLGYDTSSISMAESQSGAEKWITDGLGRHIEIFNESQVKIFEGFVNEVSVELGNLSIVRGPLLNIANRLQLLYSIIFTSSGGEQTFGPRISTSIINNTDSQEKYGIRYSTISTGRLTSDEADEVANNSLENFSQPDTSQSLSARGSSPQVTIGVRGYGYWLKYPYLSTSTGTQDLSDKIQGIITAEPNGLISTDFSQITSNTIQTNTYEQDFNDGLSLIKGLVSQGDVNDNRYLFGIYNDRIARYQQAPISLEYQQRLNDPSQQTETLTGKIVFPWNVLPGKWLLVSDFLVGKVIPSDIKLDQRAIFIEQVTYTAPWGISIRGGKIDTLSQKLAKLGLGGISV